MFDVTALTNLGIGGALTVATRYGFVWLRKRSQQAATIELALIGKEQTTEGRLWERIGKLEQRLQFLETTLLEQQNVIMAKELEIARLHNAVSDRDAIIAEKDFTISLYEKQYGPMRFVAGTATGA